MKNAKTYSTYFLILLALIYIVFLLNENSFFLCIENSDFNNLLTPIVSLFSVILLIITLKETQTFNEKQSSINEYNMLIADFELIKKSLETLKFEMDVTKFSNNFKTQLNDFKNKLEESDGINYINLFSTFFLLIEDTENDQLNKEFIRKFRIAVFFPLVKNYNNLYIFLNEIINNDRIEDRYKRKFYLKIEQLLLQHYLRVCNNFDSMENKKSFELDLLNSPAFNIDRFYMINELYLKHKDVLFVVNDLKFYKETP